ncbi:MAG: hypothetical protein ABSB19_18150 [Methylomonas sp.]|jgi:hypothetical protein
MSKIKIKCYVANSGKNEVQDVYNNGSEELKAGFEVAISYLKEMSRQHWSRPDAHRLNKVKGFKDFYEIRFRADKLQQRPIGFFWPDDNHFTILIWATEKGNKLNPESWHEKCAKRKSDIENGIASIKCLKLEGEEECLEQKLID